MLVEECAKVRSTVTSIPLTTIARCEVKPKGVDEYLGRWINIRACPSSHIAPLSYDQQTLSHESFTERKKNRLAAHTLPDLIQLLQARNSPLGSRSSLPRMVDTPSSLVADMYQKGWL